MRNYMFDRSGIGSVPAPAVRPRRRPGARGVLAAAVFLLLIAALTASSVLLYRMQDSLAGQSPSSSDRDSTGDPDFGVRPGVSAAPGEAPQTTIPRAPAGTAPLMSISDDRGAILSGAEIYEKVLPSIVSVTAYSESSGSSGSGITLSADGYIITNYHVIEGSREAWVTLLTNGLTCPAQLVGYYAELDLAVLKIDAQGLVPAEFGSSRLLEPGEPVYAIGNPMGYLYGTITDGIVSATGRSVTIGGHSMSLIQTSAALNSGNSGGALVNARGQVVGVTVAKIDPPSDVTTEGLGLAIPISEARRCVNTLLRRGEMENPAMGITCADWQEGEGVEVRSLNDDSPAKAAGLLPHDIIVAANGVPVATVDELKDVIYDAGVGEELSCSVLRGSQTLAIVFRLYEM